MICLLHHTHTDRGAVGCYRASAYLNQMNPRFSMHY